MSGIYFEVWVVFDEVIMHNSAPIFGTSSFITGGYPKNVPKRFYGLN